MTSSQLWERYCTHLTIHPEVGLTLDISRMRFPDGYMGSKKSEIDRAFVEMRDLEAGAIANPDENRMVGHYWLRTPELAPTPELKKEITFTLDRIKAFAKDIHSGAISPEKTSVFKRLVVIGIGGSALGPQLVADSLGSKHDRMKVYFCDNTDPDGIARTLELLSTDLRETVVVVISKSGGTPETRNGMLEFANAYKAQGLKFPHHAVAVTMEGSKLDSLAKDEKWLARFPMWDWVGGRTSLFSAVGLVPAALQGVNVDQFIAGARAMDEITRKPDLGNNPSMKLALMWWFAGEGKGKKDMVVLPYKDRLALYSKYLQQLVMESLGKEKDRAGKVVHQGIAVYGNKGSTDQHAYVQQLRDGLNNFFATFIRVKSDFTDFAETRSFLQVEPGATCGDFLLGFQIGTREALYENERDSITITIEQLTPNSLGALIALYERTVGFYASLVNTNAYHQPGVEAGKKAAGRVLDIQRAVLDALAKLPADAGKTATEIATLAKVPDDAETVWHILDHLAANEQRKVVARTGGASPKEAKFHRA